MIEKIKTLEDLVHIRQTNTPLDDFMRISKSMSFSDNKHYKRCYAL